MSQDWRFLIEIEDTTALDTALMARLLEQLGELPCYVGPEAWDTKTILLKANHDQSDEVLAIAARYAEQVLKSSYDRSWEQIHPTPGQITPNEVCLPA